MFPTGIRTTIQRASLPLMALLLFACSSDRGNGAADAAPDEGGSEPAAEAAAAAEAEGATASQIPTGQFAGTVTETMDAASYTYVKLEKNGESVWAAGPQKKVAVGDELIVELAMAMPGFESPALNRKFDVLYFVGAFGTPGGGGDPSMAAAADPHAGMPGMGGAPDPANPHAGIPGFEAKAAAGGATVAAIAKPDGGYQISEVWAQRNELAGSEVVMRGEVVKFNEQILGVNWIHIQDGSGDPAAGTHDLTVTTADKASVGDIVTIRGRVALDQDFGSGYRYEMLVEEASVQSE